jgi:glycosyltransferase involved in cell wall biosynthesis
LESTIDPSLFYPRDRIAARNELGLPEAEPLVGIAGSLTRSRGIELLYDAFLRLRAQGRPLSLVLAGNLDPRHPPPEDEGIRYLGRLRHEQMPVFHSALDVAVICMRDTDFGRYAFPQKAYEILACRTPLVTASVGALQRTLTGYPGCLYRPDDVDSLAEAIASQLARPQVPELEIPSWRDQARRLAAFLQRVADA